MWVERMEITIQEEKYNPFLKRRELKILVRHENEATPSKETIKNFLKEKFKVDDSQIKIDFILSKIGLAESLIKAKIYDEKIEVKKIETQPIKSEQSAKQ
jgi:small subunit ribosomal protein S24e